MEIVAGDKFKGGLTPVMYNTVKAPEGAGNLYNVKYKSGDTFIHSRVFVPKKGANVQVQVMSSGHTLKDNFEVF